MANDIKVQLDSSDINRVISEAIINSVIGKQLQEQITKQIQALSTSWNNPIEDVVKAEIRKIVVELIQARREEIVAAVTAQMTTESINAAVEKTVSKLLSDRF